MTRKKLTSFLLFILSLFLFNNIYTQERYPIQGWNILSDDMKLASEVIQRAKNYNVNHLQLSHDLLWYMHELRDENTKNNINALISEAHGAGIEDVFLWEHLFYDMDYYPEKFKISGKLNLDDPEFHQWLKDDYRELLSLIPNLDGIIITYGETKSRIDHQFSENWKTDHEKNAGIINILSELIIDELGKKLYVRAFKLSDPIEEFVVHLRSDEIILMAKEVKWDFYIFQPRQSFIDKTDHPVFIEFDAGHEYHGQGTIAFLGIDEMMNRWKYYAQHDNVIGYVARTGRFKDATVVNKPGEVYLYALDTLMISPELPIDVIYDEYIGRNYGKTTIPYLKEAFRNTYEVIHSAYYVLGFSAACHSVLDYDYNYIFLGSRTDIGHNVNKKFDYSFKSKYLIPPKEGEIENLTQEIFEDILTEKDYSVKLMEESQALLLKAEDETDNREEFDKLKHTFNRTLLTVKLHRAVTKVYFGYRLYGRGKEFRSDELLNTINEGLHEIEHTVKAMRNYPHKGTQAGEYVWIKDADNAMDYFNYVTKKGWPNLGDYTINF